MLKSRGMRILLAGVAAVLVMGTACPVFAASGIEKEETVYAVADSQLNIDEVIVSEWLKNNDEQKTITDKSDLTEMECRRKRYILSGQIRQGASYKNERQLHA